MTPEAAIFVEQASVMLSRADVMLKAGLNEDAARSAYMAAFHVAQAYIFERTDKVSKTHKGVHAEFFRLSYPDSRADQVLGKFLSKAYDFKTGADYFSGPSPTTSPEQAAGALETARRFVAHFTPLIDSPEAAGG